MTDRPRYYLTTAIFYPSKQPALHSLFEAIGADALVRYRRLMGYDVRFQTGMDEHSANVEKAATDAGVAAARSGRPVGSQLARRIRQVRDLLRPIHPDHGR